MFGSSMDFIDILIFIAFESALSKQNGAIHIFFEGFEKKLYSNLASFC